MSNLILECYEKGEATVNGRTYKFGKVTHKERKKVFGFVGKIQKNLAEGDTSFFADDDFDKIEDLMFKNMLFDNQKLSQLVDAEHFEKYGEDYIPLINIALQVFVYPFMRGRV